MFKYDYSKVLFFFLLFSAVNSFSQENIDPKTADDFFKKGNFKEALEIYKKLLGRNDHSQEYNHKVGKCYLNSNIEKTLAVPFLEKATKQSEVNPEIYFDLGKAYQYDLKFNEAIKAFNKFKSTASNKELVLVNRHIENCIVGKEMVKHPIDVDFTNVGPEINSPFPDYYPFIPKDESSLIFTTRRKGNIGNIVEFDGHYSSDIWISRNINGKFTKAKNAGILINSDYDEQAVGVSNSGDKLFVYVDKIKEFGDIYTSEKGARSFGEINLMGENVNSSKLETAASISADGSTLFFASDRPGGYGGLDLYMTRKLPNGTWALPQNLGKEINSEYNEDFPNLSADGKTLYFCSEGHSNMGGYDIFKTIWDADKNSWFGPINIGYPINNPLDNRVISFTEDGQNAYMSALRKGGLGDLDIYKIKFNNPDEQYSMLRLQLPKNNGDTTFILDADLVIYGENDKEVGMYMPNPNNGTYTIVLKKGVYKLEIVSDQHELYEEQLTINQYLINKGITKRKIRLKANP